MMIMMMISKSSLRVLYCASTIFKTLSHMKQLKKRETE